MPTKKPKLFSTPSAGGSVRPAGLEVGWSLARAPAPSRARLALRARLRRVSWALFVAGPLVAIAAVMTRMSFERMLNDPVLIAGLVGGGTLVFAAVVLRLVEIVLEHHDDVASFEPTPLFVHASPAVGRQRLVTSAAAPRAPRSMRAPQSGGRA